MSFRALYPILALLVCALFLGSPASVAPERLALVIGNAVYENESQLRNTLNDARDKAGVIRSPVTVPFVCCGGGGSWSYAADSARCTARRHNLPNLRSGNVSFRVLRLDK